VRREHERSAGEQAPPRTNEPSDWSILQTPAGRFESPVVSPAPAVAPAPRWPAGFWRTLALAASLEVVVLVLLAGTALQGRQADLFARPSHAAAATTAPPATAPAASVTPPLRFVGPPAPEDSAPEKGQVFVVTPGTSAQVLFDDQLIGRTPCYVVLPAGPQRLTLSYAADSQPMTVDVQVRARDLVIVRAIVAR
jgi:hypothetical protein